MPAKNNDEKSWLNPNKDLTEALVALTAFLKANLSAVTRKDLEKAVNQSEDRLMAVLLEIKGNMASLQEQLNALKAQQTDIATGVDSVVDSVAGLTTSIPAIAGDVAQLKALIEKLQGTPGAITPEDQALLDEIQAVNTALVAKVAKAKADVEAAKTAAAELDAATEAGGSGDGGQT